MEIEYASQSVDKNKPVVNHETKQVLNELMQTFEEFKTTNDERVAQIENKQNEDVLTRNKVDRINQSVDHLMAELKRPSQETHAVEGKHESEHKSAFKQYMRQGETARLQQLETRSINGSVNSQGGYAVPTEIDREIANKLSETSPLRSVATVKQVSVGNSYKKLYMVTKMATSWVSETSNRNETTASTFSELVIPVHEQYANPAASSTIIEDAAIDIDEWLIEALQSAFVEAEAAAFITGNGTSQPKGLLTYTTSTTGGWNKLIVSHSGHASALPTSDYGKFLVNMVYNTSLKYRRNSHWLMNKKTHAELRTIRDEAGNYLWVPPASADQSPKFLGYNVLEDLNMPDVTSNKIPIVFGDFKAGYLIVDKLGTQVMRDPYSSKPYVLFYTTRRVGGGLQDFEALHGLKVAA